MLVIALYFTVLNSCLQDVLQQELRHNSSENVIDNKEVTNRIDEDIVISNTDKPDKKGLTELQNVGSQVVYTVPNQFSNEIEAAPLQTSKEYEKITDGVEDFVNVPINGVKMMLGSLQGMGEGFFSFLKGGTDKYGDKLAK